MLWKEVKSWAKDHGYTIIKDKDDGQYYWAKLDSSNPDDSGVVPSVSKLAKTIFNHLTDNKWVDHQIEYENNKEEKKISLTDYGA